MQVVPEREVTQLARSIDRDTGNTDRGAQRDLVVQVRSVERRPESLAGWEGCWVALRGDEVIAAENTSRELVAKLHEMGPQASDAVVQYVPRRSPEIVIGVG